MDLSGITDFFQNIIDMITEFFTQLWEMIIGIFPPVE